MGLESFIPFNQYVLLFPKSSPKMLNWLLPYFQPTVTRTVNYYLESGHWFLSLYNDNGENKEVSVPV